MSDEKIYVGNAKKIPTQFGEIIRISCTEEDVEKMKQNLDNGWVNIVIKERRSPSVGGMTHYLEVDNWKPDPNKGGGPKGDAAPAADKASAPIPPQDELSPEDLPF